MGVDWGGSVQSEASWMIDSMGDRLDGSESEGEGVRERCERDVCVGQPCSGREVDVERWM